jgi:hypothetical protein
VKHSQQKTEQGNWVPLSVAEDILVLTVQTRALERAVLGLESVDVQLPVVVAVKSVCPKSA